MRSLSELLQHAEIKATSTTGPHRRFWSATAADLADRVNYEGEADTTQEA